MVPFCHSSQFPSNESGRDAAFPVPPFLFIEIGALDPLLGTFSLALFSMPTLRRQRPLSAPGSSLPFAELNPTGRL
jgi:hypothetical protein